MLCPRRRRALAQASSVAPVTITSSTNTTCDCAGIGRTLTCAHRRRRRVVLARGARSRPPRKSPMTGRPGDNARSTGGPAVPRERARAIRTVGQNPRRTNPRAEGGTGTKTAPGCRLASSASSWSIAWLTNAPVRCLTPPSLMAPTTRRRAPRYAPPEITGTPHRAVATAIDGRASGVWSRARHLEHSAMSGRRHPAHDIGASRDSSERNTAER
jgi:hypothetical protein